MRQATQLAIDGLIIHALDTKNRDEAERSEAPVPPPPATDPEVFKYFLANIRAGLADEQARTANFKDASSTWVKRFARLLESNDALVAESRELAKALFDIMKDDKRVSPGDLVVCTYTGEVMGARERYLALMKIDPTSALHQKTLEDDQGRSIISFDIIKGLLPTEGEKLQKAAFIKEIKPEGEERDYDLLVLDRQVRPVDRQGVAKFFSEGFLTSEFAFTPQELTHRLLNTLDVVERTTAPQLATDRERDLLRKRLGDFKKRRRVTLDRLPTELDLPKELAEKVAQKVGPRRFPDREFELDQEVAQRKGEKVTVYHGDHGLRIERPQRFPKERFQVKQIKEEPGRRPYHRIVIETEDWRPGS